MKEDIRKKLDHTYEAMVHVALYNHPLSEIEPHIDKGLMGYGSALDETVFGWKEFKWMIERQRKEMGEGELTIKRIPVFQESFSNDHSALIVEEFEFTINGGEETHGFTLRLSTLLDYQKDQWMIKHFHGSTADADTPEGNAWPIEEWKRRNAELQRVVEQKTAELQKNNKELEIEAALERIRSRALAMQKSDEISDVVWSVMQNMSTLDIEMNGGVSLATFISGSKDLIHWYVNPDHPESPKSMRLPYFPNLVFDEFNEAREKGSEWLARIYSFKEKNEYFNYAFEHSDFKYVPEELKKWILEQPTFGYTVVIENHCCIFLNDYTGKLFTEEENKIFKRFSLVFEQAYTRFLDLQKAEEQTKEAQIEAALERVRASAMAMHKTNELKGVIRTIFDQLALFDIDAEHAGIVVDYVEKQAWNFWIAETQDIPSRISVPYLDSLWDRQYTEAKKKGKEFFTTQLNFEEKNKFYEKLLDHIPDLSDEARDFYMNCPGLAGSTVVQEDIGLYIENFSGIPYSNEDNNILLRFGKVFQQAYTRFLDLKNAEARAREAQIEAALERVRASAMAMHKTDELKGVIRTIFDQLALFDIDAEHAGIVVDFEEKQDWNFWIAETRDIPSRISIPYLDSLWDRQFTEAKKKGEEFFTTQMNFEEKNKFYEQLLDHIPELSKEARDFYFDCPGLAISTVVQDDIGLYIENFSGIPYSNDDNNILMRFGKVFQQAYTRFLDLKNAEAQAREAHIEAALERVRSRSMAMHKSEELADLSLELVKQVQDLGVATWFCAFNIYDDDPRGSLEWGSNGQGTFPQYRTPREGIFLKYYEAGQRGETLLVHEIGEDECPAHYEYLCSLPGVGDQLLQMKAEGIPFPTSQIDHVAFFKYGYLLFISYDPVPETHDIFVRFAKVFEQTYTRFLDLQKAEAQAREAQIEAAMERVRSRAMAMQKPEELVDVAALLRKEMGLLGVEELETSSIYIHDETSGKTECWFSIQDHEQEDKLISDHMTMDLNDTWVGQQMLQFYTSEKEKCSIVMKGRNRTEWINYCTEQSDLFSVTEFYGENIPERTYHLYRFSNGYMGAASPGEISDESWNLLRRATAVFSLAYTRFSDLQTAEAQAREAQIELALERARNQSMLMQHSEELNKVSNVFHEQLLQLGIPSEFSYVWLPNEEDQTHMFWATWSENLPASQAGKKGILTSRTKAITNLLDKTEPYTAACYEMWESNQSVFVNPIPPEDVQEFFTEWEELLSEADHMKAELYPDGLYYAEAYMRYGCFGINIRRTLTEEEQQILRRFSIEFERAYTRFLDLQKAEAQAREAQIEAALEKVRSRTMAMQQSDELPELANVLYLQVRALGIPAWSSGYNILSEDKQSCIGYVSSEGQLQPSFEFPLTEESSLIAWHDAISNSDSFLEQELEGEDLKKHYQYLLSLPGVKQMADDLEEAGFPLPSYQINHLSFFEQGFLLFITYEKVPYAHDIFKRFTQVFEQSYTRFLDLKKAEEQAREAQIEAALERVRAASMAMHKTDELANVVEVLFRQFSELDLDFYQVWINIFLLEEGISNCWFSPVEGVFEEAYTAVVPLGPFEESSIKSWRAGEEFSYLSWRGLEQVDQIAMDLSEMTGHPSFAEIQKKKRMDRMEIVDCNHQYGVLAMAKNDDISDDDRAILKRFTKVFEQAYTRFLDLQKAEAQAREAQIETALERIRSRTMAMHSSNELQEAAILLFHEIQDLGLPTWSAGYNILSNDKKFAECWMSSEGAIQNPFILHYTGDESLKEQYKFFLSDDNFLIQEVSGKALEAHYANMKTIPKLGEMITQLEKSGIELPDHQINHLCKFEQGYLLFITYEPVPDAYEIFARFTKVFEQTYTRFLDLKKAEAQTREAQIEAALEKVRARTMAMQHSDELPEAANSLFLQIQDLGIPAWSAGYCIWENEEKDSATAFMSSEGVLQKPFSLPTIGVGYNFYDPLQNGASFHVEALGGEELVKHYEFMRTLPIFGEVIDGIMEAGFPLPTFQIFHILYFPHGYLMFITYEEVPHAHEIFQRFAKVFEQTYTRFLDLQTKEEQSVKLREEKERLEKTLNDLQVTQAQLIQAEKMASLGELTAGIAHEIQNPLNFVNNFSEVSGELLKEMEEELASTSFGSAQDGTLSEKDKEKMEEVMDIIGDLKQNLEKIHHHGGRADSIVKGMLQHSRTSSGEMVPTDINELADEYLRLAYHGLRAKDPTFNASMETNFDESIGKINVIPQDIGRVLLNLITNAFQACAERSRSTVSSTTLKDPNATSLSHQEDYQPKVTLTTQRLNNSTTLTIQDNGPGIPDSIKEKIFQPFFTTKPTGEGTGLGLSLAYDIVKAHGGEIKVNSKANEGTTFTVLLPVASQVN